MAQGIRILMKKFTNEVLLVVHQRVLKVISSTISETISLIIDKKLSEECTALCDILANWSVSEAEVLPRHVAALH